MAPASAASTRTTSNVFRLLESRGIPTHFVERVDAVTFRARDVQMIPLELVARRYVTGSYRDRFPELAEGALLEELVFEVFEKDDAQHDPLLEFDFAAGVLRRFVPNAVAAHAIGPHVKAGDLLGEEPIAASRYADVTPKLLAGLESLTCSAFEVIESGWKAQGGVYVDCKIECGFDRETGATCPSSRTETERPPCPRSRRSTTRSRPSRTASPDRHARLHRLPPPGSLPMATPTFSRRQVECWR